MKVGATPAHLVAMSPCRGRKSAPTRSPTRPIVAADPRGAAVEGTVLVGAGYQPPPGARPRPANVPRARDGAPEGRATACPEVRVENLLVRAGYQPQQGAHVGRCGQEPGREASVRHVMTGVSIPPAATAPEPTVRAQGVSGTGRWRSLIGERIAGCGAPGTPGTPSVDRRIRSRSRCRSGSTPARGSSSPRWRSRVPAAWEGRTTSPSSPMPSSPRTTASTPTSEVPGGGSPLGCAAPQRAVNVVSQSRFALSCHESAPFCQPRSSVFWLAEQPEPPLRM